MRCLSCHYSHKKLTQRRCPECGRKFDPNDPSTFATGPFQLVRDLWLLWIALAFIAFIAFGAFLVLRSTIFLASAD
jgi:hypothetical protein